MSGCVPEASTPTTPGSLTQRDLAKILRSLRSPFEQDEESERAAEILRRYGTNALPLLMAEVREIGRIQARNPGAAMDRKLQLMAAFKALGPMAEPLVPELIAEFRAARSLGIVPYALEMTGTEEAHRALIEGLTNANRQIRVAAIASIGSLKRHPVRARQAVPPLLQALKDRCGVVRSLAVQMLGYLRADGETVVPWLLEVAETDPDAVIRAAAISSIERFGAVPQDAKARLERIAREDRDEHVRKLAGRAMQSVNEIR